MLRTWFYLLGMNFRALSLITKKKNRKKNSNFIFQQFFFCSKSSETSKNRFLETGILGVCESSIRTDPCWHLSTLCDTTCRPLTTLVNTFDQCRPSSYSSLTLFEITTKREESSPHLRDGGHREVVTFWWQSSPGKKNHLSQVIQTRNRRSILFFISFLLSRCATTSSAPLSSSVVKASPTAHFSVWNGNEGFSLKALLLQT